MARSSQGPSCEVFLGGFLRLVVAVLLFEDVLVIAVVVVVVGVGCEAVDDAISTLVFATRLADDDDDGKLPGSDMVCVVIDSVAGGTGRDWGLA